MKRFIVLIALLWLIGCTSATPTPDDPPPVDPTEDTLPPAPTEPSAATDAPNEPATASEPRTVEFPSEDGSTLEGTYFAPSIAPAPAILLIHQFGVNRQIWRTLTEALAQQNADDPTYAILSYDVAGHGKSGGSTSSESIRASIRAAMAFLKAQPEVDAARIVLIGGSIGADGAVDECGGCVGAISLSPGNFLDVPYVDALTALNAAQDPPILCIASRDDRPSPETCEAGAAVGLSDYQTVIYDGASHGNFLLIDTAIIPAPPPMEVVLTWLAEHHPLD